MINQLMFHKSWISKLNKSTLNSHPRCLDLHSIRPYLVNSKNKEVFLQVSNKRLLLITTTLQQRKEELSSLRIILSSIIPQDQPLRRRSPLVFKGTLLQLSPKLRSDQDRPPREPPLPPSKLREVLPPNKALLRTASL
jgi:hypothetical protein